MPSGSPTIRCELNNIDNLEDKCWKIDDNTLYFVVLSIDIICYIIIRIYLRNCVFSSCTQRWVLSWYRRQDIKINNTQKWKFNLQSYINNHCAAAARRSLLANIIKLQNKKLHRILKVCKKSTEKTAWYISISL